MNSTGDAAVDNGQPAFSSSGRSLPSTSMKLSAPQDGAAVRLPFALLQLHKEEGRDSGPMSTYRWLNKSTKKVLIPLRTFAKVCGAFSTCAAAKSAADSLLLYLSVKLNLPLSKSDLIPADQEIGHLALKWRPFVSMDSMPLQISDHFIVLCRGAAIEVASLNIPSAGFNVPFPLSCKSLTQIFACIEVAPLPPEPASCASSVSSVKTNATRVPSLSEPSFTRIVQALGAIREVQAVSPSRAECLKFVELQGKLSSAENELLVAPLYTWIPLMEGGFKRFRKEPNFDPEELSVLAKEVGKSGCTLDNSGIDPVMEAEQAGETTKDSFLRSLQTPEMLILWRSVKDKAALAVLSRRVAEAALSRAVNRESGKKGSNSAALLMSQSGGLSMMPGVSKLKQQEALGMSLGHEDRDRDADKPDKVRGLSPLEITVNDKILSSDEKTKELMPPRGGQGKSAGRRDSVLDAGTPSKLHRRFSDISTSKKNVIVKKHSLLTPSTRKANGALVRDEKERETDRHDKYAAGPSDALPAESPDHTTRFSVENLSTFPTGSPGIAAPVTKSKGSASGGGTRREVAPEEHLAALMATSDARKRVLALHDEMCEKDILLRGLPSVLAAARSADCRDPNSQPILKAAEEAVVKLSAGQLSYRNRTKEEESAFIEKQITTKLTSKRLKLLQDLATMPVTAPPAGTAAVGAGSKENTTLHRSASAPLPTVTAGVVGSKNSSSIRLSSPMHSSGSSSTVTSSLAGKLEVLSQMLLVQSCRDLSIDTSDNLVE